MKTKQFLRSLNISILNRLVNKISNTNNKVKTNTLINKTDINILFHVITTTVILQISPILLF